MIDFTWSITEAEYLEAQSLFLREQNRKSRWWRLPLYGVLILSAIVAVSTSPRPLQLASIPPYAFPFIVLAFLPLWIGPVQRSGLKKRFLKERANMTSAHVVIDQTGYRCEVPGVGSGLAEWSGIESWDEGKHVIILRSGLLLRIVPKQPLTTAHLDSLRGLLAEKIGSVQGSRAGAAS